LNGFQLNFRLATNGKHSFTPMSGETDMSFRNLQWLWVKNAGSNNVT